jgi:alpha-D-ribose 1-methylphosphonate 5-triphosphate synthase subunit PhnI
MEPHPDQVIRYQGSGAIKAATKSLTGTVGCAQDPMLGHLTWRQLAQQLKAPVSSVTPTERGMLDTAWAYLDLKASQSHR